LPAYPAKPEKEGSRRVEGCVLVAAHPVPQKIATSQQQGKKEEKIGLGVK